MSTERAWRLLAAMGTNTPQESCASAERYQIEPGTSFGDWKVSGRTVDKRKKYEGRRDVIEHRVPVRCKCGFESTVAYQHLMAGRSNGCPPCRNSIKQKAKNNADWLANRIGVNGGKP